MCPVRDRCRPGGASRCRRVRYRLLLGFAAIAAVLAVAAPTAAAATCTDYPSQAAAQRAADTRDADGDGVYCESLPCPCVRPGSSSSTPAPASPSSTSTASCARPKGVQSISFSATKYPNIRTHYLDALKHGWPRILVVNRPGADARRDRLLTDVPTRAGFDRDGYPPAVGLGAGRKALKRGTDPTGWRASIAYVESGENRAHGSVLGAKLRHLCDGTRFRYVFY